MGLTSGLYLPSGVAALTSAVRKKDWGKVLSLHQLAPNLAYVAAPLAADLLLRLYPWRTALRFYGAAAVFLGLMFWLEKKAGRYHGVAPNARRIFKLLLHPPFLVLILVFSLAVGVNQGVFQMMSLYLSVERDMTPGAANRLISLSRLIALLAPLVGGWIADRVGLKKTTSVVVLGSGASTLGVVLAGPQWILAVLILQAVFSACYFPLGFAAMSQMSTPETRNLAVGLVVPAAHLFGAGFIPTAVGAAADAGYFGLGFMILGGVTAASVFLIRFLDTD
jgi:NNP family nitrate/nitrite transporter-like MFS transporter